MKSSNNRQPSDEGEDTTSAAGAWCRASVPLPVSAVFRLPTPQPADDMTANPGPPPVSHQSPKQLSLVFKWKLAVCFSLCLGILIGATIAAAITICVFVYAPVQLNQKSSAPLTTSSITSTASTPTSNNEIIMYEETYRISQIPSNLTIFIPDLPTLHHYAEKAALNLLLTEIKTKKFRFNWNVVTKNKVLNSFEQKEYLNKQAQYQIALNAETEADPAPSQSSAQSYTCECASGYQPASSGSHTCIDIDECESAPGCEHQCVNTAGAYYCHCAGGFMLSADSKACEDIDECSLGVHACSELCVNTHGSYRCECPQSMTLQPDQRTCVFINTGCARNQMRCLNGACVDDDWLCDGIVDCPFGEDEHKIICSLTMNNCSNICSHMCIGVKHGIKCVCPDGMKLDAQKVTCVDLGQCIAADHGCSHTCDNIPVNGTFQCSCPETMELADDRKTCININECERKSHNCSHQCRDEEDGYICMCPPGMQLMADGKNCECRSDQFSCKDGSCIPVQWLCDDIKDCLQNEDEGAAVCKKVDPCLNGKAGCAHICKSSKLKKNFTCSCFSGFALNADQKSCSDFNECVSANVGCSHGCINTVGSYLCTCPNGWTLQADGKTCKLTDPCQHNNGNCSHNCHFSKGSILCSCPSGLTLQSDGRSCVNIDCELLDFVCPSSGKCVPFTWVCDDVVDCPDDSADESASLCALCGKNKGGCSHICNSTSGTIVCQCPLGWYLQPDNKTCFNTPDGRCTDFQCKSGKCISQTWLCDGIDDCEPTNEDENPFMCACHKKTSGCSHLCHYNDSGTYCSCPEGMILQEDFRTCAQEEKCGCSHACMKNPDGTFICLCPGAMLLSSNGRTCLQEGNNECNPNGRAGRVCSHVCTQTERSFVCSCPAGWTLSDDRRTCIDTDECLVSNGGCSHTCTNKVGTYTCTCHQGYVLTDDGHQCSDINECNSNSGGCGGRCTNTAGSFFCSCDAGQELQADNTTCLSTACKKDNGGCSHQCVNTADDYYCTCPHNMKLANNKKLCELKACSSGEFRCADGSCILQVWHCDGHVDCPDGDDENTTSCHNPPHGCASYQYQCMSGKCIPGVWVCDGHTDCTSDPKDLNDESFCTHDDHDCAINNGECEHLCVPIGNYHRCECRNGFFLMDDEHSCMPKFPLMITHLGYDTPKYMVLWQGVLSIACIVPLSPPIPGSACSIKWYHEGREINNASDRVSITCDTVTSYKFEMSILTRTLMTPFDAGKYSCALQYEDYKVSNETVVDVLYDFVCPVSGWMTCKSTRRCLPSSVYCDGESQCLDDSDEADCVTACGNNEFMCTQFKQCIPLSWQCDGHTDCRDLSDEENCESRPSCSSSEFQCLDRTCILQLYRCDGLVQCHDGSDEFDCVIAEPYTKVGELMLLPRVYYDGRMVPLCASGWANDWSNVACHQLGYQSVSSTSMVKVTDVNPAYIQAGFGFASPQSPSQRLHEVLEFEDHCPDEKVVLLQCKARECGTQRVRSESSTATTYIVNGEDASPGKWPWQVQLLLKNNTFICGATLIDREWVLTAAHCLIYSKNPADYKLRLGSIWFHLIDTTLQVRNISKIIMHKDFNERNKNNDIALLRLSKPAVLNDYVVPACLPQSSSNVTTTKGCYVTGWGAVDRFNQDVHPLRLQEAALAIISTRRCNDAETVWQDGKPATVLDTQICAGHIQGIRTACAGDSGGPFVCQNEANSWTLAGLVSWGNGGCNTYTVFTRVSHYISWIQEMTTQN